MSAPIAPAGRLPLPTSMQYGDNALSAPTTPDRRMGVIDKSKVDPDILRAAEGMEGMFLDYMMKVMRETVPKDDMDLESPATGIYRSMLDSEYTQKAVKAGGIGLSDQIIAYLEAQRYTANQGPKEIGSPAASTGGTHESQSVRK